MALRRSKGYIRYAISCQYHGSSFLGFAFQGQNNEDTILAKSNRHTDLRGYRSVESRIRQALDDLFPSSTSSSNKSNNLLNLPTWENIQVSSRTDRGVHAIKNTFHVDILQQQHQQQGEDGDDDERMISRIHKGLNYHLARQKHSYWTYNDEHENENNEQHQEDKNFNNNNIGTKRQRREPTLGNDNNNDNSGHFYNKSNHRPPQNYNYGSDTYWNRYGTTGRVNDQLRILSVAKAPNYMENSFYDDSSQLRRQQPQCVDWNARYSATERTYVYRILCYSYQDNNNFGIPFEYDRSWMIRCCNNNSGSDDSIIDVDAMKQASTFLEGTHDFTSFRASRCKRVSPIVTIKNIQINSYPFYDPMMLLGGGGGGRGMEVAPGGGEKNTTTTTHNINIGDSISISSNHLLPQLITIQIVGNSFLYRQVRNIVGCLVEVGSGKLNPSEVKDLLEAKDRKLAPRTAPPHGLFLVDVKHGDFQF